MEPIKNIPQGVKTQNDAAVTSSTDHPTSSTTDTNIKPKGLPKYLRELLVDHIQGAQVGGALARGIINLADTQARLTGDELFHALPQIKAHLLSLPGTTINAALHFDEAHLGNLRENIVALCTEAKLAGRTGVLFGLAKASWATLPMGISLGATLGFNRINALLETISEGLDRAEAAATA